MERAATRAQRTSAGLDRYDGRSGDGRARCSKTEITSLDWTQLLQPLRVEGEIWEETAPEEQRDAVDQGTPAELFSVDLPEANERALRRIRCEHWVRSGTFQLSRSPTR